MNSFVPFPGVWPLMTRTKRLLLPSSLLLLMLLWRAVGLPLNLLQTGQPKHPRPLFTGHAFRPYLPAVALPWMHSSTFFYCGAQNCTQYLSEATTMLNIGGESLLRLAVLCFMHPRVQFVLLAAKACCWLVLSLLLPALPGLPLLTCSSCSSPSLCLCPLSFPHVAPSIFLS